MTRLIEASMIAALGSLVMVLSKVGVITNAGTNLFSRASRRGTNLARGSERRRAAGSRRDWPSWLRAACLPWRWNRDREGSIMVASPAACYNGRANDPGAQTERRGLASRRASAPGLRPVSTMLRGEDSPAAFLQD